MPVKPKLTDRLETELFAEDERLELVFDKDERDMVIRIRFGFTKMLDNPTLEDYEMRELLIATFGISQATAYRDIPIIQHLVGNMRQASKEFMRKRANYMVIKAFKMAETAESRIEVNQSEAMSKAAVAMVKINKLDKDDVFMFEWDDIGKIDYEPTDDVEVLELDKITDSLESLEQFKNDLRQKFGGSPVIQEALIVDETTDIP